jgi:acid stress-induced BolA-like protein IbaG/YrbA
LVHAALGDLLQTRIHALSIQALTPAEVFGDGRDGS